MGPQSLKFAGKEAAGKTSPGSRASCRYPQERELPWQCERNVRATGGHRELLCIEGRRVWRAEAQEFWRGGRQELGGGRNTKRTLGRRDKQSAGVVSLYILRTPPDWLAEGVVWGNMGIQGGMK